MANCCNLSVAITVPGMPASPITGAAANATTTPLASNSKAWKASRSKRPNTPPWSACAKLWGSSTPSPTLRATNTLRPSGKKILALLFCGGFCNTRWAGLISVFPKLFAAIKEVAPTAAGGHAITICEFSKRTKARCGTAHKSVSEPASTLCFFHQLLNSCAIGKRPDGRADIGLASPHGESPSFFSKTLPMVC